MHQYKFLLINADTDTLASKVSGTDADTDTLVFTEHFYLELVHYACITHHHSI